LENAAMVKRFAVVGIGSFWLLATCVAFCQSGHVAGHESRSLPDAPSPRVLIPVDNFQRAEVQARLPLTSELAAPTMRETVVPLVRAASVRAASRNADLFQSLPAEKDCAAFFCKYLYPTAPTHHLRYRPSASDSLVGRATDAASRIVITRDDSGKVRVNTTYFVRLVTSVAAHAASRPHYVRSNATAPISDFGSTIGNDAGMNLLHEFGPGLHQVVAGHSPEFVSRIEERVLHQQKPKWSAAPATR
jgi:hypothetical protein